MSKAAADRLRALPLGTFEGTAHDRRYVLSKTTHAQGRAVKLVGHALDGSDRISVNLYDLARGPRLFPCEMPLSKIEAFLADLTL